MDITLKMSAEQYKILKQAVNDGVLGNGILSEEARERGDMKESEFLARVACDELNLLNELDNLKRK